MSMSVSKVALVTAHPGHELLLHHWLELTHPTVFALTDGSGGIGRDRSAKSKAIILNSGGSVGSVYGYRPDTFWYDRILNNDPTTFFEVAQIIVKSLIDRVETVVVDAVEYFNPMHDLAAVVGYIVAKNIEARQQAPIVLCCYPIEKAMQGCIIRETTLDEDAMTRKLAAAKAYDELSPEVERLIKSSSPSRFKIERLYPMDIFSAFPETLNTQPYYETYGRQRQQQGLYSNIITYHDHVRPLARKIIGSS